METEGPRRKRRRTRTNSAPSDSGSVEDKEPSGQGMQDAANKGETYSSLVETALSVCWKVNIFD